MLVPGCSDFPENEKRMRIWGGVFASDAVFDAARHGLNILPPTGRSMTFRIVRVKTSDNILVWHGRFLNSMASDEFMVLLKEGRVPSDYWHSPVPMWVPGLEQVPGLVYEMATVFLDATPGSRTWTVPADFSPTNTFEAIGGGGGSRNAGPSGGGGGAYSRVSNLIANIAVGNVLNYTVGSFGSGTAPLPSATTFSNNASVVVLSAAPGVHPPASPSNGSSSSGGLVANNIPAGVGFSGGSSGILNGTLGYGGCGGGGSAGPAGAGASGGGNSNSGAGGGGGGANGGAAGAAGTSGAGGKGGDGRLGGSTGGGGGTSSTEAMAGQDGGGGGGGLNFGTGNGANGGIDSSAGWSGSYGPSGGGGGSGTVGTALLGGRSPYGGGAGGSVGNQSGGGPGIFVVTYTAAVTGGAQAQVVS